MTGTFLPGTLRQRIIEVMEFYGLSQSDLAMSLDMSESALSRFLSGKTNSFSQEKLTTFARTFNVSTDFLLGLSNNPKRGNVELQDLGLTSLALSNLLNHQFNKDGLNAFLENPQNSDHFAQLIEDARRSKSGYSDYDEELLDEFINNPRGTVPGGKGQEVRGE